MARMKEESSFGDMNRTTVVLFAVCLSFDEKRMLLLKIKKKTSCQQ